MRTRNTASRAAFVEGAYTSIFDSIAQTAPI